MTVADTVAATVAQRSTGGLWGRAPAPSWRVGIVGPQGVVWSRPVPWADARRMARRYRRLGVAVAVAAKGGEA